MTQVAPHSGRRARREAEKGQKQGQPQSPQHGSSPLPASQYPPAYGPAGYTPAPEPGVHPDGSHRHAAQGTNAQGYAGQAYAGQSYAGQGQFAQGPPAQDPSVQGHAGSVQGHAGLSGSALQEHREPPRGRHATTHGQNFPRVIGWTLLGSLVPGVGLVAAGRRSLGGAVLFVTALFASASVTYALVGDPKKQIEGMLSSPDDFVIVTGVLVALVLAWAVIVVGTHASLRKYAHLGTVQRVFCALLVTSLIGIVAVPTAKAGSYALILRDTLTSVFGTSSSTAAPVGGQPDVRAADPWAGTDRINVLLIGSDAGADRQGIRPDTMILASINTQTGDTVLFSLPRNLQHVPFPPNTPQAAQYQYGFYCINPSNGVNTECLMNALWTFGEEHWKDYYPTAPTKYDAGLMATKQGVEQVTGLPIDQYAMLNLRGFMQFVDAVGGITVTVKERLPIGGSAESRVATNGYLEPGTQHLNGYKALWYARSRWSTSDYSRMDRQRCVIGAVVQQADPATVALGFPKIAAAAKSNITTDIPLRDISAWVQLSQRVQKAHVRSLPFTDAVIDTTNPDFAKMRALVQKAISDVPEATPSPSVAPSPSSTKKPSSKPTPPTPAEASKAQDVTSACK